ncbi:MAG: TOBE domain-containing protein [Thermoplasmata archaeon]|nr:TOBE domain-containing protein [Thermoplasmata archaeon]
MPARTGREVVLTELDAGLLLAIEEEKNLVRACERLGIGRDRGNSRIGRLSRALGQPVVEANRGGRGKGGTRLTPMGRRLLRQSRPPHQVVPRDPARPLESTILHGTYRARPSPRVRLDSGAELFVGFRRPDGERVAVAIDPEVVLVGLGRFATSARNTLPGTVRRVHRVDANHIAVDVDVGGSVIRAGVTPESVSQLALAPAAQVYLYVKALAVRWIGPS